MTDQDKIIDKIKKCLALSASSNEHEAAAALRQAQKLMESYGITQQDVDASIATECRQKSGAKDRPAVWETMLADRICSAFGCQLVFSSYWNSGEWSFIGAGPAPEIAGYSYKVLLRQAKRARVEYIKTRLKRCKSNIKTRRADLYCEGWVRSAVAMLAKLKATDEQQSAIDAYMAKNYPAIGVLKTRNRNDGRSLRDHEYDDMYRGHLSGRNAELNHGVGSNAAPLALE